MERAMTTWNGGGIPYGYQYDYHIKQLIPHPEEKKILKAIWNLAAQGEGAMSICNYLNAHHIPSRKGKNWTITMILGLLSPARLQFYLGYDKEGNEGNWEPLLDKTVYNKIIKHTKSQNQIKKRKERTKYLLSGIGLLKCGYCGGLAKAVVVVKPKKRVHYYLCTNRQTGGQSVCPNSKLVSMPLVDKLVLTDLKVQISKQNEIKKFIAKEKKLLAEKIETTKGMLKKLLDQHLNYEALTEKIIEFQKRIDELKTNIDNIIEPSLSNEKTKTIIKNIEEIKVFTNKLEIKYRFPINSSLSHIKIVEFPNETAQRTF